jgi:hypothetical protein
MTLPSRLEIVEKVADPPWELRWVPTRSASRDQKR